jgi:hypothetical protein
MTDHDDKKPAPRAPVQGYRPPATPAGQPHPQPHTEKPHRDDDSHPQAEQHQGEHVSEFTADQLVTPASGMEGHRQMYIILGPYRGSVLTMLDAEAENAKDNHWAVEMDTVAPPFDADNPPDHDHDLTDEDRAYAIKEAEEWAAKVNDPPEAPPPEDETEAQRKARIDRNNKHNDRELRPDNPGGYETRTQPAPDKTRR